MKIAINTQEVESIVENNLTNDYEQSFAEEALNEISTAEMNKLHGRHRTRS